MIHRLNSNCCPHIFCDDLYITVVVGRPINSESGMADNSFHSRDTIYVRFRVRHFELGSRPTSVNVGSVTSESGVVENAGLAVGISLITHFIPKIQSTSGLQSAILNSGSQPSSCSINQ